jgi:undecaprenyl-diphosphatase
MLEAILLGLIQGLTEFLPVSSSGHLILAREFLNIPIENTLAFDVFLNTATLFAVIFCFWRDIKSVVKDFSTLGPSKKSRTLLYALILGSIPAGVVGFLYKTDIENAFRSSNSVALALIAGSVLMFVGDRLSRQGGLSPLKGFLTGVFQALALIPGVSRSGSTISGGLITGLSREEAIRFSFLLLIPVSCGALFKVILDAGFSNFTQFFSLDGIIAFVVAFLSGIWAVRFLVRYLSKNSFTIFIIYRLILVGLIFLIL